MSCFNRIWRTQMLVVQVLCDGSHDIRSTSAFEDYQHCSQVVGFLVTRLLFWIVFMNSFCASFVRDQCFQFSILLGSSGTLQNSPESTETDGASPFGCQPSHI